MNKSRFLLIMFFILTLTLAGCSGDKNISKTTNGEKLMQELDKITVTLDKKSELPEGIGYTLKLKNGSNYTIKQNVVFVSLPIKRGSITSSNEMKAVAKPNKLDIRPKEEILLNVFIPEENFKDNKSLDLQSPQFEIEGYINEVKSQNFFTHSGLLKQADLNANTGNQQNQFGDTYDYAQKLDENQVVSALAKEGIKLTKTKREVSPKYIFNGVKPSIYELANHKHSYLYIYTFATLSERKKVGIWNTFTDYTQNTNNDYMNVFTARNLLLIFLPEKRDISNVITYGFTIGQIIFNKLNKSEEMIFIGESQTWKAEYKIHYFQYFMKDSNGKVDYDSYQVEQGQLFYKGKNAVKVANVRYEYDYVSGTSSALDKTGKMGFGGGTGNGNIRRKDEAMILKVSWNGKTETLKLRCQE